MTPFLSFAICRLCSPLRSELRLATAHSGTTSSPPRVDRPIVGARAESEAWPEALADVLEAGHHPDTAVRLIHRWALTEPDRDQDAQHAPVISRWLALSVEAEGTAPTSQTASRRRPRRR